MRKLFYLLLLSSFITTSCYKTTQYSDIPNLTFKNLYLLSGTGNANYDFVLGFQDGNGDIGYLGTDTVYNIMVSYYYKTKEGFKRINFDSLNGPGNAQKANYAIPQFAIPSKNKSITGEINIVIDLQYTPKLFDTLQLEFSLADRAKHISNTVISPTIILHSIF